MDNKRDNRHGYHILPYRLARISETSAKIVKLITCDPTVCFTKREAQIILEIASEILDKREEGEECN